MKYREFSKKVAIYACVGTLVVGSMAGTGTLIVNAAAPSGVENVLADSSAIKITDLIKVWDQQGDTDSGWVYMGSAACKSETPDYKYLKITYKGDSTAFDLLRWIFNDKEDKEGEEIGTYWFRENAEGTLKTVGDKEIPSPTDKEQTVYIDLAASGVDLSNGLGRIHMHGEKGKGSFEITDAELLKETPDILLTGDENGQSSMVKKFSGMKDRDGKFTDKYKYQGYVTIADYTSDYRYLVFTYSGDISRFRIQFADVDESGNADIDPKFYWFDKSIDENDENKHLVSADGKDFELKGEGKTVVVDLVASGIDIEKYHSGFHMHCDGFDQHGEPEIGSARLAMTPDKKAIDVMPSKPAAEETTTVKTEETTTVKTEETTTVKKDDGKVNVEKPAAVKIKSATKAKASKKAKITIRKVSKATGYTYQISTKKNFKKKSIILKKNTKKTKVTLTSKKLKKNAKYYVRVRAYRKVAGKTYAGKWSKVKPIKVKKTK